MATTKWGGWAAETIVTFDPATGVLSVAAGVDISAQLWDAETGGGQVTPLDSVTEAPTTIITDAAGSSPAIYTATSVTSLWIDRGSGLARKQLFPASIGGAAPDASTTVKGLIERATSGEVVTGTDDVRAATPLGVAAAIADFAGDPILEASIPDLPISKITDLQTELDSKADDTGATVTSSGTIELATLTEMNTGTDTARVPTVDVVNDWGDARYALASEQGSGVTKIQAANSTGVTNTTSTTTLDDFTFAMVDGEEWFLDGVIFYWSDATAGLKLSLLIPGNPSDGTRMAGAGIGLTHGGSGNNVGTFKQDLDNAKFIQEYGGVGQSTSTANCRTVVLTNVRCFCGLDGNFRLTYAQATAHASTTRIGAGSYVTYVRGAT